MGSSLDRQGQIKPETLSSYLSALRSYHIEHELPINVFGSLRPKGSPSFLQTKPCVCPSLKRYSPGSPTTPPSIVNTNEINLDTAYKVAPTTWRNYLQKGLVSSQLLQLTRPDVSFSEFDQYVTLRLKRSKTDTQHCGVLIIIAVTYEQTCPVAALRRLFNQDPRPSDAPLFSCSNNVALSRRYVMGRLSLLQRLPCYLEPKEYPLPY